uniref:Uncharacterized protein n=1 Tax=Rhizophora mucronata TaxID=61149 RepID=A0A2P2QR54_RHIMU
MIFRTKPARYLYNNVLIYQQIKMIYTRDLFYTQAPLHHFQFQEDW